MKAVTKGAEALVLAARGLYWRPTTACVTAAVLALLAAGADPATKNEVSAKGRPMALRRVV